MVRNVMVVWVLSKARFSLLAVTLVSFSVCATLDTASVYVILIVWSLYFELGDFPAIHKSSESPQSNSLTLQSRYYKGTQLCKSLKTPIAQEPEYRHLVLSGFPKGVTRLNIFYYIQSPSVMIGQEIECLVPHQQLVSICQFNWRPFM